MGWTERQTLYSDVNAILLAYRGLINRLKAVHGDGKKDSDDGMPWWVKAKRAKQQAPLGGGGKPLVLTPTAFDNLVGPLAKKTKGMQKLKPPTGPKLKPL